MTDLLHLQSPLELEGTKCFSRFKKTESKPREQKKNSACIDYQWRCGGLMARELLPLFLTRNQFIFNHLVMAAI